MMAEVGEFQVISRMNGNWVTGLVFGALIATLPGCGKSTSSPLVQLQSDPPSAHWVSIEPATPDECPSGGTAFIRFVDKNGNEAYDSGETVESRIPVCNGANGASGTN